jgi:hypothetical protein
MVGVRILLKTATGSAPYQQPEMPKANRVVRVLTDSPLRTTDRTFKTTFSLFPPA